MSQVRRRQFLLATGALLAAPPLATAQLPARVARIALLDDADKSSRAPYWLVFRQRLHELGYLEKKNIGFETRWAEGEQERLPGLAAELVRLKPDVIVAAGTPSARAAMLATSSIPIVFTDSADPVKGELVASLARPTGNVTGLSIMSTAIVGKWIQLLREVRPAVNKIAFLGPADNAGTMAVFQQLQREAKSQNALVRMMDAHDSAGIERAFETMEGERFEAVIVTAAAILLSNQRRIVELAARRRLLAIYARREYAEAGGLMSYGTDYSVLYHRAAEYVHRILQGAKPSDLPVEQPLSLRLVVNLKTARTIGITLPQSFLLRADRVIE